jgi:hypothetical protein
MPVVISTADISAEILDGAAGWASGNHAGFHAESHEKQREQSVPHRQLARLVGEERRKRQRIGRRRERKKAGHEAAGADVRHHEEQVGGAPVRAHVVIGGNEDCGGERHHLPRKQERDRIASREDELDSSKEHIEAHANGCETRGRDGMRKISRAVDRHGNGDDAQHHQEPCGQRRDRVAEHHARCGVPKQHAFRRNTCGKTPDRRR